MRIKDRAISPMPESALRIGVNLWDGYRFVANISLTCKTTFFMFHIIKRKFLVRQAKLGESSWLRSQPDKVSRPSEPSFAFIRVIV